jgi:hypothetical protein
MMNLPTLPHPLPYISGPDEISNEDYHNGETYREFQSSTHLKHYAISPKYARYTQLNPKFEQTKGMQEGSVLHDYLASLTNYGDLRAFPWISFDEPPINSKTGKAYGKDSDAYTVALSEYLNANPGKVICEQGFIQNVERMVNELLYGNRHLSPDIQFMMKNGVAEQSHFCEYEGGLWKFRTDLKTRNKIVDWKKTTLENPKVEEFPSVIIKYGYHISAAMYQFFDAVITGKWRPFYWVVIENEPPYDFTILDSEEWSWEISRGSDGEQIVQPKVGAHQFLALMQQHLHCISEAYWPGYSIFIEPNWKGRRIGIPSVPGWYKGRIINFYNEKNDKTGSASE